MDADKKMLIFTVVMIVLLALVMVSIMVAGCVIKTLESYEKVVQEEKRFKEVYNKQADYKVLVDTTTNVCYLNTDNSFVVLVDAEGTPILWEEE